MSDTLIKHLQNSKLFEHPVNYFKVIETHISWVILTGHFAYKIKKPFNFEFLDFSKLEKRHFYCQEEIRLNKRLAPDLYVDLIPITGTAENPHLNGDKSIIEYAIKMREFSQEQLFSALLRNNKITTHMLDELAKLIAEFHKKSATAEPNTDYGTPAQVFEFAQQNFDQIRPLLFDNNDQEQLILLEDWTHQFQKKHHADFENRKKRGFIKDCHGDLHLENIILYNENPTLFDRIEFNDELRWTDVLADIGFLIMDFDDHNNPSFANRLLNQYFLNTGDYQGLTLLPYYQIYRAIVRAKINLFRLVETGISREEKIAVHTHYRDLMDLAKRYTQKIKPQLIITHGLAGTGKSSVADIVVEELAALHISSDIERKRLLNLPSHVQTQSPLNAGIYDKEITEHTYTRLFDLAKIIIQAGYPVVIDATFLKQKHREAALSLAKQFNIPFHIIHCFASREQIIEWLNQRKEQTNISSEAGVEVFTMQEKHLELLSDNEKSYTIAIDTEKYSHKKIKEIILEKLSEK